MKTNVTTAKKARIIWVTSVSASIGMLRRRAEQIAAREGSGARVRGVGLTPVPAGKQAALAEKLLADLPKGATIVAYSLLELPLLRLMYGVRHGHLPSEALVVVVISSDGKPHSIGVDSTGEFLAHWPGGFFEERAHLLFD